MDQAMVLPWRRSIIPEFLLPDGSGALLGGGLEKALALTLVRELHHCGGLVALSELFSKVAVVLFRELPHTESP